eukprot:1071143-Pyramimonas_sp.AAC.1
MDGALRGSIKQWMELYKDLIGDGWIEPEGDPIRYGWSPIEIVLEMDGTQMGLDWKWLEVHT